MPGHQGARPLGQPRTRRSIAEDKGSAPDNRDLGVPVDMDAGVPISVDGAVNDYFDEAAAARPTSFGVPADEKNPFENIRRG